MHRKAMIISLFTIFSFLTILHAQESQQSTEDVDIYEYAGKLIPTNLLDKINVEFEDVPLELALNTMRYDHGVNLSYNQSKIPRNKRVNLHMEGVYVLEALLEILKNTGMTLQITKGGNLALVERTVQSDETRTKRGGGKISGFVKDKSTGEPLPGANVYLEGTSIGAASQFDGRYLIQNVPPGSYTILVKYIGYKNAEIPIRVLSRERITINVELEYAAIETEAVTITAQAEGQMAAINQQISARTIKNVVAADRIQEIPDVNAAESVARLPGISIIRSGGEGQKVAIRGMSPKYNVMMVNGVRIQSTDREDRSVDLNMISPNILSGIEVTKAVTADMDADAVGGTVNLQISKAKTGFHSNFSMQGGYSALANVYSNYRATGLLSNRFYDDKFGIQLSGSVDKFDRSVDVLNANYTINEEETKIKGLSVIDLDRVTINDSKTTRNRRGGGLVLDYRLPNGSLLFNNFIGELSYDGVTMSNTVQVQSSNFESHTYAAKGSNTVYSNALQGEFEFFNMKMDFLLSSSVSKQDQPGGLDMRVIPLQEQAAFQTSLDETATPSEFLNGISIFDGILRTNLLTSTKIDIVETARDAMINFSLPYRFTNYVTGNLKVGGKYRYNKRENNETQRFINPDRHGPSQYFSKMMMDSLWTDLGLVLSDTEIGINAKLFEDPNYDVGKFFLGNEGVDKLFYAGSVEKMKHYRDLATQYGYFWISPQESYERDYTYRGNLSAFYVTTEMNLGKHIMLMPGIRYENFQTDYSAFGTVKYGPEWYHFSNEKLASKRKNENWFPQIHVRVKPLDWFDIRLASTRTIIYPDYRAFSPYYLFNTLGWYYLTLGNTELRPAIAQNYDIYTSLYDNYIGLFTFGYFYKEIDDLITWFNFQTSNSDKINNRVDLPRNIITHVSTSINLEAKSFVRGIEVDWQTNFWYLPSFLRGLVLNINYTRMRSESRYPYQILVKEGSGIWAKTILIDTTRSGRMPNQPNDILNTTVGYDFRDFSARLSFVFQGNVLGGIAHRKELDSFTDDFYRWDLIVNQKLPWDGFQLYFNINNITSRPDRNYNSIFELLSYVGYYGRTADLGIRYNF